MDSTDPGMGEEQEQELKQELEQGLEQELDPVEERQIAIEQRKMLISAWHTRNKLYKDLFGKYDHVTPVNYGPPSEEIEAEPAPNSGDLGGTADPGEPNLAEKHLSILAYAPDPLRPYWTYVTAGLSTPWVQEVPDEVSGFGCELMIKAPLDAEWPAQVLRSMAFYIFNHAGTISPGVRIALNAPILANSDSELRNLFVWYADEAPDAWYQLPSGGFGIFTAVGITDDELKYAESVEEYGTWCIQEVLKRIGINQLSDPLRQSVAIPANNELMKNVQRLSDKFLESGLAGMMGVE